MKIRIKSLTFILVLILILTGCSKGDKINSEDSSNKEKISNIALFLDEEGELDRNKEYVKQGRLIEIDIGINDTEDKEIYVDTYSGVYPATIFDGKLYYIGEIPDENGIIIDIIEEYVEERELTLEDFTEEGDNYVLSVENDKNLRGIMVRQEDGTSLPIDYDEGIYKIKLPKSEINNNYSITKWKGRSLLNND